MAEESTTQVTETAEQGLHDAATGTDFQTPPAAAGNDSIPSAASTGDAAKETAKDAAAPQSARETPQPAGGTRCSASGETNERAVELASPRKDASEERIKDAPITDWSKVKIDVPEGAAIDQALMDDFGKAAVAMGLTAKQANALVNFQLDAIARSREGLMQAGARELARDWGSRAAANQKAVLTLITNIDRQLGNDSFSRALNDCGATCLPAVVKGLLAVANLVSEESLGRGGAAAQPEHEETALEGLQNAFTAARKRQ